MSRQQSGDNLAAEDFEFDEERTFIRGTPPLQNAGPATRSPYQVATGEQLRGVANRIIFSRYYILFYFVMMSLSLTTVVLSLIATSAFGGFCLVWWSC
jgi:hypothetical protein